MKKLTLLDGAFGTSLWAMAENAGIEKVPVWRYNIEHPELVTALSKAYMEAGTKLLQTNTFGAVASAVKRSSKYTQEEVIRAGVRIAKEATKGTDVKISLAAGPMMEMMEPWGDLTEEECFAQYDKMFRAGMEDPDGKPDYIALETFMDVGMMRVAASAAKQFGIPVICSMTFSARGKTMMGNSVDDILEELLPVGIDAVGLNCSLGPVEALPILKEYREKTDLPIFFKPNAGLPVTAGGKEYPYSAEQFAEEVRPALEDADFIGSCCGSDVEYIKCLAKLIRENA